MLAENSDPALPECVNWCAPEVLIGGKVCDVIVAG